MEIIKRTLLIAVVLLTLLMLVALMLPRNISIIKFTETTGEPDCASELVGNFDNWSQWFPAIKENDSKLETESSQSAEIRTPRGATSHIQMVTQKKDSVLFHITSGKQDAEFLFLFQEGNNNTTKINMIVNTRLRWYPWERAKGIIIEKMTGPQYEAALENIRQACSQRSQETSDGF